MANPDGSLLIDSTGRRRLDSGGRLMLGNGTTDGCCCSTPCQCPGNDCIHCGPCTPIRWTLDFADIDLQTACWVGTGRCAGYYRITSGALDGRYVLTQTGDPCYWSLTVTPSPVIGKKYASAGCTGSELTANILVVTLQKFSANQYWLKAQIQGGYSIILFEGVVTVPLSNDCTTAFNVDNDYTEAQCDPWGSTSPVLGFNGSAQLAPCDGESAMAPSPESLAALAKASPAPCAGCGGKSLTDLAADPAAMERAIGE